MEQKFAQLGKRTIVGYGPKGINQDGPSAGINGNHVEHHERCEGQVYPRPTGETQRAFVQRVP